MNSVHQRYSGLEAHGEFFDAMTDQHERAICPGALLPSFADVIGCVFRKPV
ncbi:hypothetical protein [Afifella pfennigii]|uniref:hypothetical protein n=1 Tax=Afifella pfennigii TaxID=209897 RepID=UPI00146FAF50|nr:hypothetical protein [Afifella pfennigii]